MLELAAIWELMNKGIIPLKPAACYSEMWNKIVAIMEKQIEKENRETGLIKIFHGINEIADYFVRVLHNSI